MPVKHFNEPLETRARDAGGLLMSPSASAAIKESDKARACWHEASHYVVSGVFKADFYCWVSEVGEPTWRASSFAGASIHLKTSAWREAVISWGGIIGETIASKRSGQWRYWLEKLWRNLQISGLGLISLSDAGGIARYPRKRKSFDAAMQIIKDHLGTVKFVANQLSNHGWYRASRNEKNEPVYLPAPPEEIAVRQKDRLTVLSQRPAGKVPFDLRLAHVMPIQTERQRVALYRVYLTESIRSTLTRCGRDSSASTCSRIAAENEEIDR